MSDIFQNLGAQALNGTYNAINTFDTIVSSLGLGPTVSLKSQSRSKRELLLIKSIQAKQWSRAEELIKSQPSSEICLIVDNVVEDIKLTSNIELWAEIQPNNYWAQLFFANRLIKKAWDARGSGIASTVSTSMFEKFWDYLSFSKDVLLKASILEPSRAEPFVALIKIEMGLGYNNEELWQHFIQLGKRDKKHYVGFCQMLHALCKKWGGSHDEMFDIARIGSENALDGSLMYGLVPMAHIERWLYFSMEDQEEEANQYFFRDEVSAEINSAYQKFRSVSDNSRTTVYFDVLNKFTFCFYLGGEEKSKELLKKVGYNATDYPWSYQMEPFLSAFDAGHSFSQALKYAGIGKSELAIKI